MNTSKIIVRLEAEERTAELEMRAPHDSKPIEGLESTLRRLGMRATNKLELSTPRFRVTRVKFAEIDGSLLDSTRLMQVLRAMHQAAGSTSNERRRYAA